MLPVTGNTLIRWSLRPGMDLREALAEADARMYQDKEDYYRENPEMKRRTP